MSWPRAAALILLVACPAIAGAALPLETEDTGTTERVELATATAYRSAPDGDTGLLAVTVNVGLRENLEVNATGTLALDDPADGGPRSGLGDSVVGVKYRFLDEVPPWPALLARVTVQFPTGDETRGLGAGDVLAQGLLVVSRTLGPVTLMGNAGYTITTGAADADVVVLAASVEWAMGGPWSLVGEVVGEIAVGRDADDTAVTRLGVRWDVFDAGDTKGLLRKATLSAAVGVGLTVASPDVSAVLGLTLTY